MTGAISGGISWVEGRGGDAALGGCQPVAHRQPEHDCVRGCSALQLHRLLAGERQ